MAASEPEQSPEEVTRSRRLVYDALFQALDRRGGALTSCYVEAFGDDALIDADPFGAIAASELRWLIDTAGLGSGQTVVDIGCGRGGPGLVVARWTGARMIGVDSSIVGVAVAARRAATAGLRTSASYLACDARELPFTDHSIDAFISIDVIQLIPNRELVFAEVVRVLRPDGVFAFSSWERTIDDETAPEGFQRVPRDFTKLVEDAHMQMRAVQVPPGARQRSERFWERVRASADQIRADLGAEVASHVIDEASRVDFFLASSRRVLCVARS